eukprot:928935-Pelagomonas_calceolata.AAC.2
MGLVLRFGGKQTVTQEIPPTSCISTSHTLEHLKELGPTLGAIQINLKLQFRLEYILTLFTGCMHIFLPVSVRYSGYSLCHPPHDDDIMLQLLCHALHSSIQTDAPVATFMLLPHWRGSSGNTYMNWINNYSRYVSMLAKFPARYIKFELPQY